MRTIQPKASPTQRTLGQRTIRALSLGILTLGIPAALPSLACKGAAGDRQGQGARGAKGAKDAVGGEVKASRLLVASPAAAAQAWVPPQREGSRYRLDGQPRTYDRETIFELLNGGADSLLEAGLVTLVHARLKDDAQVFTDCEIQVMDVSSPAKAKAMLRSEKAPEAKAEKLGDEGFTEATSVLFAKGRHLVRVTALPSGARKTAPVIEIARRVEATKAASW